MDKILVRQHLNTIIDAMNMYQAQIDTIDEALTHDGPDDKEVLKHVRYIKMNMLCDLDTIRQEYQKELNK